jgi:hypothetical protein
MESDHSPSTTDARKSLDLVADTRADLADRLVTPWWYHPGLGLVVAALVVGLAIPNPVKGVLVVAAILGLVLLVVRYSHVTGLGFSDEYMKLAFGPLVLLLAVVLGAMFVVLAFPHPLAVGIAAAVVFVATIVFGRRADEAMRIKLRERDSATA